MKNFLGSISKRDLIFISIILILLIVMVVSDTSVDILVNYDEEMLYVTSPRLNIDIHHESVLSVELIDMPEFGQMTDGYEHEAYKAGIWANEVWGAYTLCVIPSNTKCILVKLDGVPAQVVPIVVFSCTTDEKTLALFESYSSYLKQ